MLVACRLAGLSALVLDYTVNSAGAQLACRRVRVSLWTPRSSGSLGARLVQDPQGDLAKAMQATIAFHRP
jgi:hypothetical protein